MATIYVPVKHADRVIIFAGAAAADEWNACSQVTICTETIVKEGVGSENQCWAFWHKSQPAPVIHAEPGNLYIYTHPNGGLGLFFHRMLDVPTGIPWSKPPG